MVYEGHLPALILALLLGGCGPGLDEGGCRGDGDCQLCEGCVQGRCLLDESLLNPCGECGPTPGEVCGDTIDNDCDGATDEAECLDPCESVVCDDPPTACFESVGSCADLVCHYGFLNGADCDDGDPCTEPDTCTNGVCAGTPRSCSERPAAECSDANTLRTYSVPGSCKGGACEYPHEDTTCVTGCAGGACNAVPGEERWRFEIGDRIESSPAIAPDGTIYLSEIGYMLFAVNPDGSVKWQHRTDEATYGSTPAIGDDGTIYIGSGLYEGVLYALRPDDGEERWRFTASGALASSPAIGSDGTIYIGSDDYNLYAIDPADGTERWHFETTYNVRCAPAVGADGTVYVGADDGYLYAVNPTDGSEKWHFRTGLYVRSSPALGSDGTIYFGSSDNNVYAVRTNDGSEKWRFETGSEVFSSPVIGKTGVVFIGSCDGNLYALKPEDGAELWRFKTGSCIPSAPAIAADDTIYVGSWDGYVYALRASDGKEQWRFKTSYVTYSSPAIGADGTVYFGSNTADNGWLHAVVGTAPLADTPWPKYHANLRNTGRR